MKKNSLGLMERGDTETVIKGMRVCAPEIQCEK